MKRSDQEEQRVWSEMSDGDRKGGLCECNITIFPPFCLGPSVDVVDPAPDATPWFGTLCISALSLFPAEPAPMQTHGQPVGFLI